MNTSNIKKYAPKARVSFQQAVIAKANSLGISESNIEVATQSGDFLTVADRTFPASIKSARDLLVREVELHGFEYVIEHVASTWFNRFCAIRFMELQGYLEHGYRVLSHPTEENSFEILSYIADVADDFSLNREKLLDLSLAGNNEEEIYRQLILGQCHTLHQAMEFLFEKIDGVCELLLPDGLTRTDSIIRDLVNDIPEGDWQNVEIIGWLYQFYISEKKDEVIGKVVKSEDIPAATQLFTPNWIVQYLVQNSVGRQWLQTYPESPIKVEMPYYIEPAEQSDEVNKQLAEITPSSLDPETIKVLDPACGSGHILVEAYKTLKAIYTDRTYKPRDIPKLILEKNLFGLDIDDRAAQLAGFALMMMARADDRRIFTRGVKLNVLSLQETAKLDIDSLWQKLGLNSQSAVGSNDDLFAEDQNDDSQEDPNYKLLVKCKEWFLQAKTLGSLIDVPESNHKELFVLFSKLSDLIESGSINQKSSALLILPVVKQALLLSQKYLTVIANPPFIGWKGMNLGLRNFAKENYKESKSDLFAMFIERNTKFCDVEGKLGFVTPFTWMFIKSYEKLRHRILRFNNLESLIQPEYHAFFDSAYVPLSTFIIGKTHISNFKGSFIKLSDFYGAELQAVKTLEAINKRDCGWLFESVPDDFTKIPSAPISFWAPKEVFDIFSNCPPLSSVAKPCQGIKTGENDKFLRFWHEVNRSSSFMIGNSDKKLSKWFPCTKGGNYRKWYGNHNYVLNWESDGFEIRNFVDDNGNQRSRPQNINMFFKEGGSWSTISSSDFSMRYFPDTFVFESKGSVCFPFEKVNTFEMLSLANSDAANLFLNFVSPTLDFSEGSIGKLPLPEKVSLNGGIAEQLINAHKEDWDIFESSWDFKCSPLTCDYAQNGSNLIAESYSIFESSNLIRVEKVIYLEQENNQIINKSLGLSSITGSKTRLDKVTLLSNPVYRYGVKLDESKLKIRSQSDSLSELISYSIGCMMGRYSLDREGLVYAQAGNEGFEDLVTDGAFQSFPADDDGIVPLTDMEWFPDDATYRFRCFVKAVWGEDHLQENLDFVAESLCLHAINPKRGESSLVTIRRYMSNQFFKEHLKTYKKRPIYWLFSSGKQKSFECLVYLHRYNEGTLARMRTQYVTPLIGKYQARIGQLEQKLENASTSEKAKLAKDITLLEKKQVELRAFDDNLKHYADMRISIDLDDGVKVNYGKFGSLLAEVKAVHGKAVK
jgi:type II restriction/modification system DNA methylase subunit YeeA